MRKSVKSALALMATVAMVPVVFASASSATDLGGLNAVTNGNDLSTVSAVSDDGNLVVFHTEATDLPGAATVGGKNIILHNISANTYTAITNTTGTSEFPTISGNGAYVAYHAAGSGNTNIVVYNVSTQAKTTVATAPNDGLEYPSVANNGTVVFQSAATNLVAGDVVDTVVDVFMTPLGGATVKISDGTFAGGSGAGFGSVISDDASVVAYLGTTASISDLYIYKTATDTGTVGTKATSGNASSGELSISNNGSKVAFRSYATNIDGGTVGDVFTYDTGTAGFVKHTSLASAASFPAISGDGAYITYSFGNQPATAGVIGLDAKNFYRLKVSDNSVIALVDNANGFGGYASMNQDGTKAVFVSLSDNLYPTMNDNGNVVLWGESLTTPVTTTTTTTTVAPTTTTTAPPTPDPVCTSTAPPASAGYGLTPTPSDRNTLYRAYCVTLFRYPDMGGFNYWLGVRQAGVSWQFIEDTMADSPEFKQRYGTLNDVDFVKRLYVDVLERGSDKDGLAYWTGLLTSKALNRGEILFQFSDSQEFKNQTGTA